MNEERLQEIKKNVRSWRDWATHTHAAELDLSDIKEIEWLISEVERLQVENDELKGKLDFAKGVNQLNFDTAFKTQQKVERLEKTLKFYARKAAYENGGILLDEGRTARKALE